MSNVITLQPRRAGKSTAVEKPWLTEPNEADFRIFGLRCHLKRVPTLGHWCGYVRIPCGTALYRHLRKRQQARRRIPKEYRFRDKWSAPTLYDDRRLNSIEVHGGLTFGGPLHSRKHPGLWIGFDCGHAGDVSPGIREIFGTVFGGEQYRTLAYVLEETVQLAYSLKLVLGEDCN